MFDSYYDLRLVTCELLHINFALYEYFINIGNAIHYDHSKINCNITKFCKCYSCEFVSE